MTENTAAGQTPEEQEAAVNVEDPAAAEQAPKETAAEETAAPEQETAREDLNPDDIEMPDASRSEMEKEILAEMERQESSEAGSEKPQVAEEAAAEEPPSEEEVLAELNELERQEEESSEPQVIGDAVGDSPTVSPVQMGELKRTGRSGQPRNIDILMDVKLPVSIELGRTQMNVHDILELAPGSVVELNKLAGEPVDLLVNNKVVARGEVVVVDENFGLRVISLISPEDRLKSI